MRLHTVWLNTHLYPLISWAGPCMKGITSTHRRTLWRWLVVNHSQTRSAQVCVCVSAAGVLSAQVECHSFMELAISLLSWVNHCLRLAATVTQQVSGGRVTGADSESITEGNWAFHHSPRSYSAVEGFIFCLFNIYLSLSMLTFKIKGDPQTIDWLPAKIESTRLQAEQPLPAFGSSLLVAVFGGWW